MTTDHILHRQLSYDTVGVLMEVHNTLGPGWNEVAYHHATMEGLKAAGIPAKSKLGGRLLHHDVLANVFELDVLVADRLILELKHLDGGFADAHFVQLINYLLPCPLRHHPLPPTAHPFAAFPNSLPSAP